MQGRDSLQVTVQRQLQLLEVLHRSTSSYYKAAIRPVEHPQMTNLLSVHRYSRTAVQLQCIQFRPAYKKFYLLYNIRKVDTCTMC